MGIPHILTDIINRPVMATPAKLQVVMNLLGDHTGLPFDLDLSHLGHMSSPAGTEVKAEARPVNETEENRIAVVSALGSLVARNHGMSDGDGSGLRSYRSLMMDIQQCRRDSTIGGIILDADSYGGSSAGCERATRFIHEVAQEMPVYGVVDLNAYSAMYSLLSGCTRIILTDRTAGVGSIGCIAIHMDVSKWADKEGLKFTIITFGKNKAEFNSYEPLSKDAVEKLQRSVDEHGMRFAQTVAELRNLKLEDVLAMEAGCYSGQEAVDIGLADEIASFEDAVAMLTDDMEERKTSRKATGIFAGTASDVTETGGSDMTTQERMAALLAADDGPEAIAALGYLKKEDAEKAQAAATAEAVAAERKQLLDVVDIAELAELPIAQTASLLREGSTPEKARETVQQLRANKSSKTTVSSTITPLSGDERHPLLSSLEKKYQTKAA